MMVITSSLQLSHLLGIYKNHGCNKKSKVEKYVLNLYILCLLHEYSPFILFSQNINIHFQSTMRINKSSLLSSNLSIFPLDSWSVHVSKQIQWPGLSAQCKYNSFACQSFLKPGHTFDIACLKNAAVTLTRPCNAFQGSALVHNLIPAIGIVFFTVYGLGPLTRLSRNIFLHKTDNSWKKSSSYYVMSSYLQPMLLWTGATLICRALDPVVLPTEASQIVKQRLLNFLRSLSTVLAFAFCLSSLVQQAQKFFIETNEATDTRNMGFQFAGKAIYTAVWVAAVSLFMELLGFSAQKWLTAGGLGTVLLTLAGREIFTNFLSSVMIHATRPFVMNEWIQTKIEGYEVSGTVEHVGWWSPTIIRGEDREAVHIPNHKFTVNVVRNLTQKSHWRIKTHLAISHLDVNKINNIVADMRKVLAKNPQVEQQKLHRRVFLDNINPENQALLILVSCFVKTSHFEEYLCVKEAILLDLLRVIRHHRARLATPIRTVQKIFSDTDLENIPFEPVVTRAAPTNRPLLLIEPSYKINGEERAKRQTRPIHTNGEQDGKSAVQPAPDNKIDIKGGTTHKSDSKAKEMQSSMANDIPPSEAKAEEMQNPNTKEDHKIARTCIQNAKPSDKTMTKSSEFVSNANSKFEAVSGSESKAQNSDSSNQVAKKQAKKAGQENAWQVENSSASLPESGNEIPGSFSSPSQSKQDNKRSPVAQPTASKSTLEENIVLGVALDGSKRTLPIDEEMVPPIPSAEIKELTKYPGGSGPSASEEDGKNGQA